MNTLLVKPTTRCFTLVNASNIEDRTPDNTIPSCLFPYTTRLRPNILCIFIAPPTNKPPFTPNQTSKYK